MSSAIRVDLDQSKILLSGNGLVDCNMKWFIYKYDNVMTYWDILGIMDHREAVDPPLIETFITVREPRRGDLRLKRDKGTEREVIWIRGRTAQMRLLKWIPTR